MLEGILLRVQFSDSGGTWAVEMRTIRLMTFGAIAALCCASIGLATSAHAFKQENAAASGAANATSKSEAQSLGDADVGTLAAPDDQGVSIAIPGLGNLGVIPKLDFGLDLLYGQKVAPQLGAPSVERDEDGLRVRGTIRHRF